MALAASLLNAYLLEVIERETARLTVNQVLERAARRAERSPISAVEVLAAAHAERDCKLDVTWSSLTVALSWTR